ncbi:MAG: hypothetical protein JF565_13885 [Propionibacteriales bacterium]|nr:hypothetical protein [Propionibacteriales bacterium]
MVSTGSVSTSSTTGGFSRAEIEEFWDSWLDINREAERRGEWGIMADWYAEDATYGWMYTPDEHFMVGGSWFGVERQPGGDLKIGWQRDWFDLGSTAHTFLAIAASGKAPQGLLDRMSLNGMEQPGHYRLDDLPSTVWPPPVERGDFVTQESAR